MADLTLIVGQIPASLSAFLSLYVGTIGDEIRFTFLRAVAGADGATTVLNLSGATLTWISEDGRQRTLTVQSAGSALATYTTSARDFEAPLMQQGQVRLSLASGQRFYTPPFLVHVAGHL